MTPIELSQWFDRLANLFDEGVITLAEFQQITDSALEHVKIC